MTDVTAGRLSGNNNRRIAESPHDDLADAVTVSRFWRLVDRKADDDCWLFQGYLDRNGYGVFVDGTGRKRPAHELALSYTTGEMKLPGLDTCHSCDRPTCCNPNHLRFDTRQSNVDDMVKRERGARGSRSPHTHLTEADVVLIRRRREMGARHKDLAIDFNISPGAVTAIVHGRNWKHVGGPITNRSKSSTKKDS